MASYNSITLVGNLTRDPEVRTITTSGSKVVSTGIAVNESWKDKVSGETKQKTMFVDLQAFGKVGEVIATYLKKGAPVLIEGRLELSSWEKDGQKFSKHFVTVGRMQMLGAKTSDTEANMAPVSTEVRNVNAQVNGELPQFTEADIPF